ncbi:MAG: hypothetical protein CMO73_08495 [Verrucomicrobiales bacterium]|nr:hypothetical protein [Verrucomicrobiales bacterium]|tara:strand:+ start:1463 stop:2689 length:1227 start_codon:yes stop_codon:yes gene_type:complete
MRNISRKEFLKVGAALPLAMNSLSLSAKEKEKSSPRRIIFINNSLGFYAPYFFPKKREDLSTSDYLKGMKTKEKMTVFQNFFHPGMETSNHDSEKSFLTGTPNPESSNFVNGTSLDQLLAKEMGKDTRFPFLNFSIYDRGWGCSWNDRGSAIPPMHDEEKIFEMLFEEEDLRSKKQQLENDKNILNCLRRDLQQLRNQGSDPNKLDNYKAVIGELETRLNHENFWLETKKPKVEKSLSKDKQFEFSTKVKNLFELAKLAFQTDSTRVITFSMDWIYGAIKVPGATGGWHTLSHHGGRKDVITKLSQIEIDVLKHFNNFLFEMDQINEGNGTLLDHTTVVMGSNFGDSSNHTCNNLPMIVAGGGYQHESHKVMQKPTPLCNLYLELLHKHNMDFGNFGSSEKDMNLLKS